MRRSVLSLAIVLLAFPAAVLAAATGGTPAPALTGTPVLTYHRFDPAKGGSTTISLPVFEAQLDWLAAHGYRIVRLQAVVDRLLDKDGPVVEPGTAAIAVDDGHRSVYTELFPLIRSRQLPVTLFIYPSAISNAPYALTWAQLEEMRDSGLVDVESHTYWHPDFRRERASRSDADYRAFADRQLRSSKARLESRLGRPVDLLAWPWGYCDAELERAAAAAGYRAAFALGDRPLQAGDDRFALPRIMIFDSDRGADFAALVRRGRPRAIKAAKP